MRLQVKGRHVDVTDSLFQYAEKKLGKLARHLSDESRCELELIVEHNPSISDSQVGSIGSTGWPSRAMFPMDRTATSGRSSGRRSGFCSVK